MIFITVGTSLPHDELIRHMDELVKKGRIKDKIIAQIGDGKYIPKNFRYARFIKNMEDGYNRADIIVSNCGAGTILENVTKGRRLIVIQNPDVTGGHEWELVKKMEDGGHLIWCKNIDELADCIDVAKDTLFNMFIPERLDIVLTIKELISR